MKIEIIDNREDKRFEAEVDGYVSRIEYIRTKDKIYLTHTEVPVELEGRGVGSVLVKTVLEEVERQNLILVPMCPFVASYIKQHPEWKKLVMKGINIQ